MRGKCRSVLRLFSQRATTVTDSVCTICKTPISHTHAGTSPTNATAVTRYTPRRVKAISSTVLQWRLCSQSYRTITPANAKIGRAHVELQSRGHLVCRLLLEKKKSH